MSFEEKGGVTLACVTKEDMVGAQDRYFAYLANSRLFFFSFSIISA